MRFGLMQMGGKNFHCNWDVCQKIRWHLISHLLSLWPFATNLSKTPRLDGDSGPRQSSLPVMQPLAISHFTLCTAWHNNKIIRYKKTKKSDGWGSQAGNKVRTKSPRSLAIVTTSLRPSMLSWIDNSSKKQGETARCWTDPFCLWCKDLTKLK